MSYQSIREMDKGFCPNFLQFVQVKKTYALFRKPVTKLSAKEMLQVSNREKSGHCQATSRSFYFCRSFLKVLTEGAVTTEAGSLFQYFTTVSIAGGLHLE